MVAVSLRPSMAHEVKTSQGRDGAIGSEKVPTTATGEGGLEPAEFEAVA
jgi:hypothetical protein